MCIRDRIEPVTRLNNIRQRYDPNCQFAELLIANYDLHERERASVQLNLFDFDMKETCLLYTSRCV